MGISQRQAVDCFASDDLIGIGMEADSVRRSLHPDGIVSYAVDRAFGMTQNQLTQTLTPEISTTQNLLSQNTSELLDAIESVVAEGVAAVRIVTPPHAAAQLPEIEATLAAVRHRFPALRIQALSAHEIAAIAASSGLRQEEILTRLRSAGLDAIGGTASGVSRECWLELHAAAHRLGLRSQACVVFGGPVGTEELVTHLMAVHALQDSTSGFTALSLQGFRPEGGRAEFEQPTAVEYLRTLAIARMLLDNIENIESSGVDYGLKVMQMALRFGANDGGTIAGPESGGVASFTESDLRRVIRDAGLAPVERDALYRVMFLNA